MRNNKGFTLVELIVVIAIIAILASVGIIGYTQFIKNARDSAAQNELNQVYNVIFTDAAAVGLLGEDEDWQATTNDGKIKITFEPGANVGESLSELLARYLNAGFYQGKFIFEKDKMTYIRPEGGKYSRDLELDISEQVSIIVGEDGTPIVE